MAVDSDKKLTTFYDSGRVIVTSEFANSLYGGLHSTTDGDLLDPEDPQLLGHIHDGQHSDGHAQKIDLEEHVTSQLKNVNLGDAAVQVRNIQCYPESMLDKAIPIYDIIDGEKCYYLDLSLLSIGAAGEDTQVQFNEDGDFGANAGFVYRYSAESVGIRVDDMDQNEEYALSVRGSTQVYDDSLTGVTVLSDGSFPLAGTAWTASDGFSIPAGPEYAIYSHDAIGGILSQDVSASISSNRWYKLTYVISNSVDYGTIFATVTTDIAGTEVELPISNGAHSVEFKANSAPTDFKISVTSADASEMFIIDDIFMGELLGGNVDVHGVITGGGPAGIKITSDGEVGIGTDEPASLLHISGDGVVSPARIDNLPVGSGTAIAVSVTGEVYQDPTIGVQNLFSTINIVDDSMGVSSGGPIVADSPTDILTLDAGGGIEIVGHSSVDKVSILLNADLDHLSDVDDPPGFSSPGDVLTWDGYEWSPEAPSGSGSGVKFVSQWTSTADWVQKFGDPDFKHLQGTDSGAPNYHPGGYRNRFAPYVFYVPDFSNNNNPGLVGNTIRILRDSSSVLIPGAHGVEYPVPIFNLTTAIPLNGDVSAGIGASIVGSHQGSLPGYIDAVSGFPDDPPSSCRVTLYFLLADGVQGIEKDNFANFNVDLLCMKPLGPLEAPMLEYQDGELIWGGINSGMHSSTTIMRSSHSYTNVINGTLVVSDFSPLKIDLSKGNGGLCTFTAIISSVLPGGYFGTAMATGQGSPVANGIGLIGARLLWVWDDDAPAENNQPANAPPSSQIVITSGNSQDYLGNNGSVNDDTNVLVSGAGSSDPDGDSLSYMWTYLVDGYAVDGYYESPPGDVVSFPIDTSLLGGSTVEVRLVVSDGSLSSLQSVTSFDVIALNQPPVAQIIYSPIAGVTTNTTVILDGTTSFDSDGVISAYQWTVEAAPMGAVAIIAAPSAASTTMTADTVGSYTVRLTVTDDDGEQSYLDQGIAWINQLPFVLINSVTGNLETGIGQSIMLNASSSDNDGTITTYAWTVVSSPGGASTSFGSVSSEDTTFSTDSAGVHTVRLTVVDDLGGASFSDKSFVVSVPNQPPVVVIDSVTGTLETGANISLNATVTDPEAGALTYLWSTQSSPNNSIVSFTSPTSEDTGITVWPVGSYTVRLTATDNLGSSAYDDATFSVSAPNQAPTVVVDSVTGTLEIGQGQNINIAATASDSDGTISTYAWTVVSSPNNSNTSFSTQTSEDTGFITDAIGNYTVRLTVTDNDGATGFGEILFSVSAQNQPPIVVVDAASGTLETGAGQSIDLTATSSDPEAGPLTYLWTIQSSPANASSSFTLYTSEDTGFVTDTIGSYTVRLTVTDNAALTAFGETTFSVVAPNQPPTAVIQLVGQPFQPVGATVVFDGASSSDADGIISSYNWTLTSAPLQSAAVLVSINGGTGRKLVPDVQGVYRVTLSVTDDDGATSTSVFADLTAT